MSFFAELKRRNVFRVGIAYLAAAWLVMQFADAVLNNIEAPGWVFKVIMLVLAIGLPLVLVFAWAFEKTPDGPRKETDIDGSQPKTPQISRKLNIAILVLLALVIAYLLYGKFFESNDAGPKSFSRQSSGRVIGTEENKALTPAEANQGAGAMQTVSRQSIAVLPFDNRSPDANDAYFAEGIHGELLTNLARIGSLKVISRTSVAQYKDTEKTIPNIARELGVATVMEGAVQRSGNQVRINVQLIDAQTDEHLWAEIFDRELTTNNLFSIQSEISEAIASSLKTKLTSEEQRQINTVPTQNMLAYETYLRGKQLMATRNPAKLEQALTEFGNAVRLDPNFALAWAGKADTLLLLTVYGTRPHRESYEQAREAVNRALAIDDRLGEAYASLAQVLVFFNEWDLAEAAHRKSIELSPNYATAWHWYSNNAGMYPVRVDDSLEMALKAYELDPLSPIINSNLAHKYRLKGLYSMSERQYLRNIELNPDFSPAYSSLGLLYSESLGDFAKAIPYYAKAIALTPGNILQRLRVLEIYLELGDFEAANEVRMQMAELSPDHLLLGYADVAINFYRSNDAAAREAINHTLPKAQAITEAVNLLAVIEATIGDLQRARDIYLAATPGWMTPELWTRLIDKYTGDACIVSWLLLRTGEEKLGRDLLDLASTFIEQDLPAVMEHADTWRPEICQAARGDFEMALNSLQTRLNHGHLLNWQLTTRLPMWDPVRDDPRYTAIQQEFARKIAVQRNEVQALRAKAAL